MKDSLYFAARCACRVVAPLYALLHTLCTKANHILLAAYYQGKFEHIGKRVKFYPECSSFRYEKISLGDNVFVGKGAYFRAELEVRDDVMFGPSVYITDGRHHYETIGATIASQGAAEKNKVVIEDDCWIGQGAFIGGGVTVGEGSVVGAMSVVTKDVPPYSINVGSPCRSISTRYTDEELLEHLRARGRDLDEAHLVLEKRRSMMVARSAMQRS